MSYKFKALLPSIPIFPSFSTFNATVSAKREKQPLAQLLYNRIQIGYDLCGSYVVVVVCLFVCFLCVSMNINFLCKGVVTSGLIGLSTIPPYFVC